MAGQPDGDEDKADVPTVTQAELESQLTAFKGQLQVAIGTHDGSVDADRRIAVLQRQLANQQALLSLHVGAIDTWAKASREAVRHGELAVKLAKATLADRVAVLEQAHADIRHKGKTIASEAKRRRESTKE